MLRHLILKYLVLIIGIIFLIGASFAVIKKINLLNSYNKTSGVVIDFYGDYPSKSRSKFKSKSSRYYSSEKKLYAPIVTFKDDIGNKYKFVGEVYSSSPSYDINDKVVVFYNPLKPQSALISSFTSFWLLPLILGLFGTFFTLIGALLSTTFKK